MSRQPPSLDRVFQQLQAGQLMQAEATLQNVLQASLQDAQLLATASRLYLNPFNNPKQAAFYLEQALELAPQQAIFHFNLGRIYERLHKPQQALQAYYQAWALGPHPSLFDFILALETDPGKKSLFLARQALQSERYEDALNHYRQSHQQAPEDRERALEYANLLLRLGHENEGLAIFQQRLTQHPKCCHTREQLGLYLRRQGRFDAAKAEFERLLNAPEYSAKAQIYLAETALMQEDLQASTEHYARYFARAKAAPNWAEKQWQEKIAYTDYGVRLSKKIRHDQQYLLYLQQHPEQCPQQIAPKALEQGIQAYHLLWQRVEAELQTQQLTLKTSQDIDALLAQHAWVYPLHSPSAQCLTTQDFRQIEADFRASGNQFCVVDHVLEPQTLDALYHFCLSANVWHHYLHGVSYICAYPQNGINQPLFYQLVRDLRRALPQIIKDYPLKKFWMYKYSSQQEQGVQLHTDSGALNLNFWLTPEQGNKNTRSGGLVIYDKGLPLLKTDQEITQLNRNPQALQTFLQQNQAKATAIPYRHNRLAIFDSNLLHQSMPFDFVDAYPYQRINLTLVFGERGQ